MTVEELLSKLESIVQDNPDMLKYQVTTEGFTVGTDDVEVDETLREICIV